MTQRQTATGRSFPAIVPELGPAQNENRKYTVHCQYAIRNIKEKGLSLVKAYISSADDETN